MKISMHTMAVDTFAPMLEDLSALLDKGAAYASEKNLDLMNARLAPDMFTLTKQVQIACDQAKNCVFLLMGKEAPKVEDNEKTISDLKARIAKTVDYVRKADPAAFSGAEERDCSLPLPNNLVLEMNGLQFLKDWSLPHFYFHVVTAYDILRHSGVSIGKQDYLRHVGALIHEQR